MTDPQEFFPLVYGPGLPGQIAGFDFPGTLVPVGALARQQQEAHDRQLAEVTEKARKSRRNHLLLFRR